MPKKEEPARRETRAEKFARLQVEESERRFAAYLATLSPRDRERLPRARAT